jgi:predicted nucleic acid-binding OB-fold protein
MARVTKRSLEKENEGLVTIIQMQSVLINEAVMIAKELNDELTKVEKKLKKYKDLDNDIKDFNKTIRGKRPQEPRWQ